MMPGSRSDGPAWQARDDRSVQRDSARRGERGPRTGREDDAGTSKGRMLAGDGHRRDGACIDETRTKRLEFGLPNGYTASGANPPLVGAVRSEIAMSRLTRTVWNHSETGSLQNMYSRTASVMATMVGR